MPARIRAVDSTGEESQGRTARGERRPMRSAIDAVGGTRDHHDPRRRELGRQIGGDSLAVGGGGPCSDDGDGGLWRVADRPAPCPQRDGRVRTEVGEARRPARVAGDEELHPRASCRADRGVGDPLVVSRQPPGSRLAEVVVDVLERPPQGVDGPVRAKECAGRAVSRLDEHAPDRPRERALRIGAVVHSVEKPACGCLGDLRRFHAAIPRRRYRARPMSS